MKGEVTWPSIEVSRSDHAAEWYRTLEHNNPLPSKVCLYYNCLQDVARGGGEAR
jgi:hypothetical protein